MKMLNIFKHIFGLTLLTFSVYGANVTFHVDMQFETVTNGVYLAGGDAGNPGYEMTDEDGDNIYSLTIELTQEAYGDWFGYKFVNGPIDAGWQGAWEVVPNACGFGEHADRRAAVLEDNYELPPVVFGDCSPDGQTTMVFRVDMQYEEVSIDGVWLAGGTAGNPGFPMFPGENGIWSRTLSINENTAFTYKFVNGMIDAGWQGAWEEVPDACGVGDFNDRSVDVGTEDTTLPAIVFGTCDEAVTEVDVTFHVDMQHEEVSTGGVWLAGGNAGNPGFEMNDGDGDGIYSLVLTLGINSTFGYKFSNGPINPDWSGGWEEVPVACAFGDFADRSVSVGIAPLELPPVVFGECTADGAVLVTFQVDMQNEVLIDGTVWLAGGNAGNPGYQMMNEGGGSIYSHTLVLGSGTNFGYKFVNGPIDAGWNGAWEEVPAACAFGDFADRQVTIIEADMLLPPVAFGSCDPIPVESATVTFQADMSNLIAQGWNGETSTMNVMGMLTNWGDGAIMIEDLVNPSIYTFTTEPITAPVGSLHEWKFKAFSEAVSFTNGGWEVGENFILEFTGEDIILEPMVPRINILGELANAVTVDIHVTWNEGTLNVNTGEPFPETPDTLIMNGDFLNGWGTWGDCMGADCATPVGPASNIPRLTDSDGDGIYTGTLELPAGHGNVLTYKLGAYYPGVENTADVATNGAMDNEGGFGADKIFIIPTSTDENIALETVFGDNNPLNPFLPVQITFHLDMRDHQVSDDGVHVAGTINSWSTTATPLHDEDGDGIYIGHAEATPGDTIYYKFLNGNSWGTDEAVPDPSCGGAGGYGSDRFYHVPQGDSDIPLVCFGECITCEESYVTFHVDMSEVESISENGVFVGGGVFYPDFHLMEEVDENLYALKTVLPEGTHLYKFNNGGTDATYEDGGALSAEGCGVGAYNDREILVGELDMMTEPFCYSSCYTCSGGVDPVEANVTFSADMSILLAQGWDMETYSMNIMGTLTNWDTGLPMAPDLIDPNIYSLTATVLAIPGSMQEWKFRAFPGENFTNGGWEVGSNHLVEFTGEDLVLETMVPNINITGELLNNVTVDIHALWRPGVYNVNTGEVFPEVPDTLIMNGDFLNGWGTWGDCMGADCATPAGPASSIPRLTDLDGDGIYTGTLELPLGHGNILTYKLGAYYAGVENTADLAENGAMDNEGGFGADKIFVINPSTSGTIVLETVFGDNNPMNDALSTDNNFGFMPKEFALLGNYPNPFNPVTTLQFDLDYLSNVKVTVFNIAGNEVVTLKEGELEPGRHSIQWNASNNSGQKVPSGLYLYRVTSDNRTLTGKMLLLK